MAQRRVPGEPGAAVQEWEESGTREISDLVWTLTAGAILLLGAFLRIYELALKPLHHDEGVNGFFLGRLINEGVYTYDPENYHGPTLYYFTLISTACNSFFHGGNGLSNVAVRLVPALFGVATIWLVLCLRRYVGTVGALAGAALLAVSPGAVYMSRYFIHESLFVFFTLGVVVAWLRYYDSEPPVQSREPLRPLVVSASVLMLMGTLGAIYRPAYFRFEIFVLLLSLVSLAVLLWLYDGERAPYLILAVLSAALLFATKETAIISAGVLMIAAVSAVVYLRLLRPQQQFNRPKKLKHRQKSRRATPAGALQARWRETLGRFGGPAHIAVLAVAALALFLTVGAIFYSSFFTNAKGVGDAFATFKVWARTGTKDHTHPWYKYALWLGGEEAGLLLMGGAGIVLAILKGANRFAVFAALWAFGIVAAYSLIPYKTPWLALNFIVPLAVIAGYAVEQSYGLATDLFQRLLLLVVLAAVLGMAGYQAVSLNFVHYDDERYAYVYSHTVRGFLPLVDEINRLSQQAGTGKQTGITITSPDYWPLPWYLRDYTKVGYYGKTTRGMEALLICEQWQEEELRNRFGLDQLYERVNAYPLRPNVNLVLYMRRGLFENRESPSDASAPPSHD